ncbi:MAG TPA: hypothetical protein VFS05_01320 [Gemmatimonadaceae bacterium]|nr:hypothetical protein [Gemmatimonadaceae bacterium]
MSRAEAGTVERAGDRRRHADGAPRARRPTVRAPASLAGVHAGETVEIESILFESLRELCAELGLHAGDQVCCRAHGQGFLFLEARGGRVVSLERDWARFVAVRRADPEATR